MSDTSQLLEADMTEDEMSRICTEALRSNGEPMTTEELTEIVNEVQRMQLQGILFVGWRRGDLMIGIDDSGELTVSLADNG